MGALQCTHSMHAILVLLANPRCLRIAPLSGLLSVRAKIGF